MKRGLVISGGGSKGAFAGGIIEYLNQQDITWNVGAGSSTGALLLPLSILGDISTLKEYYTNITTEDIFNISAFKENGKLRVLNAIWRLIRGKTSFGEGENLLKNIRRTLTEDKWEVLKTSSAQVYITVTNFTKGKTEYKSIQDCTYAEFTNYMLASASVPGAFDIVTIDDNQYLDGGILETVPLQKMVNEGCDEIDVIVLKVKEERLKEGSEQCENILDVLIRTIGLMNKEIGYDDIDVGTLEGNQSEIKLNFYYLPHSLTTNAISFDSGQMKQWWKQGFDFAKTKSNYKEVIIKKYKSGYKRK